MKPLKLTLRGINSYRTEQVIDFESLTSSGLFGIFGPTGSGKSSILDAITLALYAKLPRSTKNFININEKNAAVSFLFSITTTETHRYQVERSFRYHGEKENATVRNISGRLLDVTGESPIVLADRPTEVTQECIRLLGLTSDDFMRTVVLPQGQFSEFLKLKNADRRNMLQRIFHLEKYGLELTQKIAQARQKQDLLLSNLEGQLNVYEEITPEKLQNLREQLTILSEENKTLASDVKKAENAFKEADELHNLLKEYEPLKQSFEKLMEELPSIQAREKKLELRKKANYLRPFVDQSKKAETSYQEAVTTLEASRSSLTRFLSHFHQLEKEKEKIQKEYAEKLPLFVAQQEKLRTAIQQVTTINTWTEQKELLQNTLKEQNLLLKTHQEKQEEFLQLGKRYKEKIQQAETMAEHLRPSPEELRALEKGRTLEETYREKRNAYEKNQKRFLVKQKQQQDEQKDLEQLCIRLDFLSRQAILRKQTSTEKLEENKKKQNHLQEKRQKISHEIETLQNQNMALSIRKTLQEGEPCPVCGSFHHHPEELPEHNTLLSSEYEQVLKQKQQLLNTLEQDEKRLLREQSTLERQLSLMESALQLIPAFREEIFCPPLSDTDNLPTRKKDMTTEEICQQIQETASLYSSARGSFLQRNKTSEEEQQHLKEEYTLLQASASHILNLRNQWNIENFTIALEEKQKEEEKSKKLLQDIKELRKKMEENDQNNQKETGIILKLSQQISSLKSDISNHEKFIEEQKAKIPADLPQNTDYGTLLSTVLEEKRYLEERKQQLEETYQKDSALLLQKKEQLSAADSRSKSCFSFKQEADKQLNAELIKQQFTPDTDFESLYISEEEITTETSHLENYQNTITRTTERLKDLEGKIKNRSIRLEEWQKCKDNYERIQQGFESKRQEETLLRHQAEVCQTQLSQKEKLLKDQSAAIHKRGLIRQLEQLFKGNAFIEYVAESRLKYIASEASSILYSISNGNYALEVNEATEFIIRDNKNGGILRPCDTLSGGETFITSLSLALALSSVIQLNGTAPLELFFLDEGFGSLDDDLLDVVMTSLERLQNKRRSIGIITHVEAIQARVPVKLIVTPSDISQNGSSIRLEYS